MKKLLLLCMLFSAISYASQRVVVAEEFTRVGG